MFEILNRKVQLALYLLEWVQESCQATKLLPGHPLTYIYTLQKIISKFDIHRYGFLGRARRTRRPAS